MKIGKALCLLALMPLAAQAQWAGTTELGILAHYTKLDDDVLLGKTSVGVGGRIGFFALRYLSFEAEYSLGSIDDNVRDVSHWRVFRGFVNGNISLGSRARLILGAGYKHDTWAGDTTANEFEDGFTMDAGLRFCFGEAWSFRPDVVFDKNPSPNFQTPVTSTSRHFSFRVGLSRFFGRGHSSCRASDEMAAAPATPPATPPAAPAPTVSLTATPSSILAGQNATLSWSSTNATTCTAPWTSSTATSGTQSVSPTATTSYTITCTGSGGSASGSANVSVAMPAPPTPPTPPNPPPTQQPPREVFRLEGVYFDFDKSIIKPEGRVKLDSAVTILNRYSDMRVEIQGHTDSIGTEEYNVGLSNRRANAVKEYLMSKGIAESRLTTRGFGETSPATSNATAEGRAMNRRVILVEIRN